MKRRHLVVLIVVTLAAMGSVREALADAAPPPPPSAGSVENGEYPTMVQMESENVIMTIADDIAYVKATFNMRNQGTEDEAFDVRFPVDTNMYSSVGEVVTIPVHNFAAYVDGKSAEVAYTSYPDPIYSSCEGCPELHWATWSVTFPPGQPVSLGVIYRVDAYGGRGLQRYTYVLHTGAGWFEPIRQGTITIRLPYDVNEQNVVHIQPDYAKISGTDIIWQFTDLEPTEYDDISVSVMSPPTWRAIQAAQLEVNRNPNSPQAHLRLARALMEMVDMGRCGLSGLGSEGHPYYDQITNGIVNEYQRALELEPDNIELHSDYVELLYSGCAPSDMITSALQDALATDPNAFAFQKVISEYDLGRFLTLTATAIQVQYPTSTPRPTRTPTITSTPIPTLTSTPISISTPPSNSTPPITLWAAIGAAAIGGAGVGVWMRRRKRHA